LAKASWPARSTLAWLLAQHRWIGPIPGTRRIPRVEENIAATAVALSADEVAELNALATTLSVAGNRYNDAGMSMVGL
jgi:aryl-alcohol dehydrogenase-like predicted oxidoreductase